MKLLRYLFICFSFFLTLFACSPTKHLAEGELLYTGTTIVFENPKQVNKKGQITSDLSLLARPIPNTGWLKLRLAIYNKTAIPTKERGIRHWLKYKLGEAPALYEEVLLERSRLKMGKYLLDHGYFGAKVTYDTLLKKKKISATYRITSNGQYRVRSVQLPQDSTLLGHTIRAFQEKTFLKAGAFYQQANLYGERNRLATLANDKGFVDFSTDYLFYFVDTAIGTNQADIFIEIKPPTDSTSHKIYYLGDTYVFPNYDLNTSETTTLQDTLEKKEGIKIIQSGKILRPNALDRAIAQDKGELFCKKFQTITVNHLLDLGVFKFVNLKYIRHQDSLQNRLDRYLHLTPGQFIEVTGELELNNRTGNFLGTAATVTYLHKNLFHGAERLSISLSGGIETQNIEGLSFINTADLNLQADIIAPKFITPFKVKKTSRYFVPSTKLGIGNNFQRRTSFYTLNATHLKFGYQWREVPEVGHEFLPITLTRVNLLNNTSTFDTLLLNNPRLKSSFDDVFILGLAYTYTYSSQKPNQQEAATFFRASIETSGNLFSSASKVLGSNNDEPNELAGTPVSQFFKLSTDFRYYLPLKTKLLIIRIAPGIGIAYGNSEVLPYTKQYFVGGSNSLRAFRLRGLGPGSFIPIIDETEETISNFIDQTGDIKLEMAVEYRFDLISYLKGAVFLDAGNVWLLSSEDRPEGVFHFNQFLKEIAIDGGLGFRLDFDYFVLRLDAAFPLRKPFRGRGFDWTFSDLQFGNPSWRKENVVWNFTIGYPF